MKKLRIPFMAVALAFGIFGCDQAPAQDAQRPATEPVSPTADKLLTRRNYYVIFDGSGSMDESKCAGSSTKVEVAKQAIKNFAKALKPEDNLALFAFDSHGVSERIPLGVGNRTTFDWEVMKVRASGGTPLYGSISIAFGKLKEQMQKQLNYGEYHLVIVTDGEASDRENGVMEQINQTPIIVHTIGFCIGPGHSLNQPGKTYYADAKSPAAVNKGLQDILAESEKFGK